MDALKTVRKLDSFKDIPFRDLASGSFTKPKNQLKSYRKSLSRLQSQRRVLSQQILQTQSKIEELNQKARDTDVEEEKAEIESKISELKESLKMNAESLKRYDMETAVTQSEIDKREQEMKKAEVARKEIVNAAIEQGLNTALPGSGFVYRHRKLIAVLVAITVVITLTIIFSVIKSFDSPGATVETIFNSQCLDSTDPNCVSKVIENGVSKSFENRTE